jgi:vancomycin permeability regulator SanA
VLGALVRPDGTPSSFLTARLELARRLFDAGKVRVLLVSGDHSRPDYDEPGTMRDWLVAHGVPARRVVVDDAGVDTYDSCARANRIFGVRQAIVVTQTYHLDRAVTLCRRLGVDAAGVGDDSVRDHWFSWWRASVRERAACVKAVVDLATRRDPKFLGPGENGVRDALRSG